MKAFFTNRAVNLGTVTSTKLLVFQCHTLVVANIKSEVGRKDDLSTHATLPTAERKRLQKKPLKQLSLDNDSLTVKEKPSDHVCSTKTELELVQSLRRRALTFDLIGLISYETMNNYHADLLNHLQEDAPPGYCNTTVTQVLHADRAAFLHLAETMTSLKRNISGERPLEIELPKVLTGLT